MTLYPMGFMCHLCGQISTDFLEFHDRNNGYLRRVCRTCAEAIIKKFEEEKP